MRTLDGLSKDISTPVDIVIVDDGSKEPVQVPNKVAMHNVVLLRLLENRGIEHALNKGLNYIFDHKYKYVMRLDAGDMPINNRINKQLKLLEDNPEIAMVGSHVQFVDSEGQIKFIFSVPLTYEQIRRKMHINSCFSHPAIMVRTSVLKEIGPYSSDYPAAEDYDLFFRIVKKYKCVNIDSILTSTEYNPAGISISRRKSQLSSRIRIQLEHFDPQIFESYWGLFKSLLLYIVPYKIVVKIKGKLSKKLY
jgi:cellulose synthase/poly-beta-1,6-N-acetylglucosamine synthase-like glycosyltransferase